MNTYIKCFNSIKLALIRKDKYTYIIHNKKNFLSLNLLLTYNIIIGFKIIIKKNKKFFFVICNNNVNYYNIKNVYKKTNPILLRHKFLNNVTNKNTSTKYILSTSLGFIELQEAINKKIGGILILKLY